MLAYWNYLLCIINVICSTCVLLAGTTQNVLGHRLSLYINRLLPLSLQSAPFLRAVGGVGKLNLVIQTLKAGGGKNKQLNLQLGPQCSC